MKKIILIFLFSLLIFHVNGQVKKHNSILKQARHEVASFRYAYSIPLYKLYLNQAQKDTLALKELAYAYHKLNRYDSSLIYLEKAISLGLKQNSFVAELYANVGQYVKSKIVYKNLIDSNKTKIAEARLYGFTHLDNLIEDSLDYVIFNTKINTPYNEFNGTYYKDGIIFESNRIQLRKKKNGKVGKKLLKNKEFSWDGSGFTKLYYYANLDSIKSSATPVSYWVEKKPPLKYFNYSSNSPNDSKKKLKSYDLNLITYNSNEAQSFDAFLGNDMNVGAVSFTADGKKAYYTRNQKKSKGVYQLEIWEASFINNKWVNARKMFFNNPNFSYFHPAVTSNGQRLFYVSDDNSGYGGTDIFYIDKQPDGSWKNTVNLGQDINTEGNELFPTVQEGSLFISSNGHPGLGGLDIYQIIPSKKGETVIKNLGYPINSTKDDFSFNIKLNSGFFSSNRSGNDDILAFEHKNALVSVGGKILLDSTNIPGKYVYLYQNNNNSLLLIDSAIIDNNSSYSFNVRPNKKYEIVAFNDKGLKFSQEIISDGYSIHDNTYQKKLALINIPLADKERNAIIAIQESNKAASLARLTKKAIKTIDSLKNITKLYIELHHPFDQVYVVKKDLNDYYKLIEIVKRVKNKKIVIVSATDCNGTNDYNEELSIRRAKRIYTSLAKLSNNEIIIKNVGERELLKDCNELYKSKEEQLINRYSYVFIIDK